ncbi:MAG TPA: hypothetical protein VKM93_25110 [Terriglobia bacterium]|nr:hypothetical protein [Terriglobia bacterium]
MCEKCEREEVMWALRVRVFFGALTLMLIGLAGHWLLSRSPVLTLVIPVIVLVMVAVVWGVFTKRFKTVVVKEGDDKTPCTVQG